MPFRGLTEAEAAVRLAEEGPNSLPDTDRRGLLRIFIETLREPMFALLLAGGAVYLIVGELSDALVLLVFAQFSVLIAVVQGYRSERVLAALKSLSAPSTTVIRDGAHRIISSVDLVRGDMIIASEGERLAADCILRAGDQIEADESLLTGESAPVRKTCTLATPDPCAPGGDGGPFLYSGALVVRGQGVAEVVATGVRTEIGKIGSALGAIEQQPTRLTLETQRIVRIVGVAAFVVCGLVVLIFGLYRASWLEGGLAGIALGMAMLPEEFPLILTVFMVMGAWRISRAKVLTRRPAAIETLGAASVLCTDKTGTLTENRMSIARVWTWSGDEAVSDAPSERARPVISTGVLASAQQPFDPMERAFIDAGQGWMASVPGEIEKVYGLSPDLLAVTQVWPATGQSQRVVAVKGAPEAIIGLCRLDPAEASRVKAAVEAYAADGLRVLAAARGDWPSDRDLPVSPADFQLTFEGLVGLQDPLRADVPAAVAECRKAGVRVVMITGDYPATAVAIARDAGIDATHCMTGAELADLTDAELSARIGAVGVFARIQPAQKLRIVQALQATGAVVAMTGDGVNDAPALKAADIGIAMGKRGSDVAREASSLILMEDDFGSIVKTMRLGRRIYDNLQKAMGFVLSVHVPIAGLALFPLLSGFPIILAPVHIAFLEMIIDPTCSIAFEAEPEERDLMLRPPRDPAGALFSRAWVTLSLIRGLIVLAVVVGVYVLCDQLRLPAAQARGVTYVALVLGLVGLMRANRRIGRKVGRRIGRKIGPGQVISRALKHMNAAAVSISVFVFLVTMVIVASPFARQIFGFGELTLQGVLIAVGAGGLCMLLLMATGGGRHQSARSRTVAPSRT